MLEGIAKWLNDGVEHPCSFSNAYTNFETWQAMYHSYLEGGQITLPLEKPMDEIAELRNRIPDKKLIVAFDESNGNRFLKRTFDIGGEKYTGFKFGSVIYPFKMFPVLMIFDEKSTEFEANIRVLFDGSAHHYLKTDVVKLIIIYIVKKLCSK